MFLIEVNFVTFPDVFAKSVKLSGGFISIKDVYICCILLSI